MAQAMASHLARVHPQSAAPEARRGSREGGRFVKSEIQEITLATRLVEIPHFREEVVFPTFFVKFGVVPSCLVVSRLVWALANWL